MTAPSLFPSRPLPAKPPADYSLAHGLRGSRRAASVHYVAAPIYYTRPSKGTHRTLVTCPTCQKRVTVLVRSPAAVKLERLKRVIYILLIALVFYAFVALIPWGRLLGSQESCVGLLAFFAFGALALYHGARVIAPDSALQVDLPARLFQDILPPFSSRDSHTILRKK